MRSAAAARAEAGWPDMDILTRPRFWSVAALRRAPYISAMPRRKEPPETTSPMPGAAKRALAEAEARRKAAAQAFPPELGGREGPEPVRYGDWEKKGLAVDF